MVRLSRVLLATVSAAILLAIAAPTPAQAMPPSPDLLARAKTDPALAASLKAAQAANPDVPATKVSLRTSALGLPAYQVEPALAPAGSWNLCVILARYSDTAETTSAAYFQNLYYGTGSGPATLRGYYRDASFYGNGGPRQIDIQSGGQTLFYWVHLPQTRAYYATRGAQMVRDSIAAADAMGVDFAPFDNDGNGVIDAVQVVHVGNGYESSGDPLDIWSYASGFGASTAPNPLA
jgi:immune inhibitor A